MNDTFLMSLACQPLDGEAAHSGAYIYSLARSLNLALDEFYTTIRAVGVSAGTGEGMPELFAAIADARQEYLDFYAAGVREAAATTAAEGGGGGGGAGAAAPAAAGVPPAIAGVLATAAALKPAARVSSGGGGGGGGGGGAAAE